MTVRERKRTLYVSDMDGTLLQPEARLSAETIRLLNEAIAEGALFTVATARTPATVSPLLAEVNLRLPAIVMTGAAQWCKQTGDYSHVRPMDSDAVRQLVAIYRDNRLPTFLYALRDNIIHIYHLGPLSPLEEEFIAERLNSPFKAFHIDCGEWELPEEAYDNVVLLFAMQPSAEVENVYNKIKDRGDCNPVFYHDMYGESVGMMEVFSPAATKAAAIRDLASEIGAERIEVFGDNVNDLPMFAIADHSVAVANARPEVIARASEVIGANTEDAVAHYILDDYK